jgi:two-component system chemotaxis response regulator CheY
MKVVVVDDASFMRKVYSDIVKEKGYSVVGEGATGREAIELYRELKPDLIMMDVVMPDATGLEAVREILAIDPNARIIIITAADDEAIRKDALALGARGFVRKPPEPEMLGDILDELAQEARSDSPVSRIAQIYTAMLRELTQFVRSYFGNEADEALCKALQEHADVDPDLAMDKALTVSAVEADVKEVNERLNALLEVGLQALVEKIGKTQAVEIFREAFKIVFQRSDEDFMEKLEVMFPPWLEAEVVRMERANWVANLDMVKKDHDITGGHIYLIEEPEPKEAYDIFTAFSITGTPGMIISRTSPKEIQERFKTGPAKLIWLTYNKVPDVECIEPTGSGLLYKRLSEFIQDHERCIVIIDGLEYLISQTSFGGAQKLVQAIHDDVMLTQAIILVPFDKEVLDQKQMHFLSRELKNLKPRVRKG